MNSQGVKVQNLSGNLTSGRLEIKRFSNFSENKVIVHCAIWYRRQFIKAPIVQFLKPVLIPLTIDCNRTDNYKIKCISNKKSNQTFPNSRFYYRSKLKGLTLHFHLCSTQSHGTPMLSQFSSEEQSSVKMDWSSVFHPSNSSTLGMLITRSFRKCEFKKLIFYGIITYQPFVYLKVKGVQRRISIFEEE